jgi:hypothetical protein
MNFSPLPVYKRYIYLFPQCASSFLLLDHLVMNFYENQSLYSYACFPVNSESFMYVQDVVDTVANLYVSRSKQTNGEREALSASPARAEYWQTRICFD